MKLVIRHRPPRSFRTACPQITRLLRNAARGACGVALRLRRPLKAPMNAPRRNGYVDARTFIQARSEKHLHFSQHLHLALFSHSAPSASVFSVSKSRDASPVRRMHRHWRHARAWLMPAGSTVALTPTRAVADGLRAAVPVTEWRATPMRNRRHPEAPISSNPRTARGASPSSGYEHAPAQTEVPRMLARMRIAGRAREVVEEAEKLERAVALRHRTVAAVRNRAEAAAELQLQARALRYSPPVRPVTLIYRKATTGAPPQERGMDLMQLARGEFPPPGNLMSPSAHAVARQATAPPAAPRFDSGMLDGLADDIIRRIDKRARVERERRGL